MKFWILLLCVAVGIKAQSDEAADYWNEDFDDQWYKAELEKLGIISNDEQEAPQDDNNFNDYDNIINIGAQEKDQKIMDRYEAELVKQGIISNDDQEAPEDDNNFNDYDNIINIGAQEKDQNEMDKQVEEEIQEFQEKDNTNNRVNNDYLVEDNRSASADNTDNQNEGTADDENLEFPRDVNDINENDENDENENIYDDYKAQLDDNVDTVLDDLVKDFFDSHESDEYDANEANEEPNQVSKNDDMIPLPMPPQQNDNNEQILEETKAILLEDTNKPNDFADVQVNVEVGDDLTDIFEETKKLIEETNDNLDEEAANDSQQVNERVRENSQQEDLSESDENLQDLVGKLESAGDDTIDEAEDTVDKVYQDLNEDLDSLFETLNKLTNRASDDHASVNVDYAVNSNENLDDEKDYETVFDSNLSDLFAEHSKVENNSADTNHVIEETPEFQSWLGDEPIDTKQNNGEPLQLEVEVEEPSDEETVKVETTTNNTKVSDKVVQNAYINDAFVSKDNDDEPIKSIYADDLSDDQLDQLMNDFAVQHKDVFEIEQTDDDQVVLNHIVKEITLKYGETQFITTDNYPEGYPTNRITDWIIIGEGEGIEFNVTAFSVNSALGDYLLVKPGQLDDSGSDGLLFSYHLNNPRAYLFADVDRLFMRFESKNGFIFHTGFNITVKMIAPIAEDPEPEPEPEPLQPEPVHHLTVILGGLSLAEFTKVREDFRLLVANMATMYINANGIDPGMNTTAEITQITLASICNVKWPGYEMCVNVRVAVPLVYEDQQPRLDVQDLQAMWNGYANLDPFAARLRQMGITEFSVPDDGGVLTVWLVVGLGVLVSAIMMAFALWRYSCFKDYSRMPEFSDSDSISHKRLDLYPTPHQTLPPLYSDSEYKWDKYEDSTRVDMGGFTNRSYVRNDMYDLDSDEDVVAPRDRYTTDV